MKFKDKFYDIIGHNKCPSSEKSAEKCILKKSYFHRILPIHGISQIILYTFNLCFLGKIRTDNGRIGS